MTESYPPAWQYNGNAEGAHAAPTVEYTDPATVVADDNGLAPEPDTESDQGKAGAAKEQAAAVGQGAAEAGQQVASVAKDQAQNVVSEAGSQAKDLIGQARSELTDQAAAQQQRLAAGLRALGDELESMTHHSEQPGPATDLARQASARAHDTASWLDAREPGHLLQELQTFARQKPGSFLALAAAAGLVAGRLGRGVKDAAGDDATGDDATSDDAAANGAAATAPPVPTADGEHPVGFRAGGGSL